MKDEEGVLNLKAGSCSIGGHKKSKINHLQI